MMYATEQLVGDYLIPSLAAIKCDFCQKTVTSPKELELFDQVESDTGIKDICPTCLKQLSPN